MNVTRIALPTHLSAQLVGYVVGGHCWLFANERYQPSYWMMLKREGFSSNLLQQASNELESLTDRFDWDELSVIYQLYHHAKPTNWVTYTLRNDVERLILSGRIKVFQLARQQQARLANADDPLFSGPGDTGATSNSLVAKRNILANELGRIIVERWVGKDESDRLHWDRWLLWRKVVETYDVGAEVVDTAVDLVVGLWDIGRFLVTITGDIIEFDLKVLATAKKAFEQDNEGVIADIQALGIAIDKKLASAEALIRQAKRGLEIFNQLNNDPLTRQLMIDFFDSYYQSIHYRKRRTLGVRVVSEIGIEVLLAIASGGSGNVARRSAQAGAHAGQVGRAGKHIGPFSAKAIDDMADMARALDKSAIKIEPPPKPIRVEVPESAKPARALDNTRAQKAIDYPNDKITQGFRINRKNVAKSEKIRGQTDITNPREVSSAYREIAAAEHAAKRSDVERVFLGDEAYKRTYNVESVPKIKETNIDVLAEVKGGKFDLGEGKGASNVGSAQKQFNAVGKQLGKENVRFQDVFVKDGIVDPPYSVSAGGVLMQGGTMVRANGKPIYIHAVKQGN